MSKEEKIYINKYKITRLDTSCEDNKYRLTSSKADLKINDSTKELLKFIENNQGKTISQLSNLYSATTYETYASVKKTLKVLIQKDILTNNPSNYDSISNRTNLSNRSNMENLWFRKKLLDVDNFSKFFEKFKFTFSKPSIVLVFASFLFLDGFFFYSIISSGWGYELKYYTSYDYIFLVPISLVMGILHELGHTVATKRHKLSMPKGIGTGLYYFMIVFYADTHESWNLPRRKRAVVSIAGVYWNIIALVFLIPTCFVTKSAALKDFILLVHISAISVFNPFLKMDGYWLLTDLLGVVNLHKKVRKYFKSFFGEQEKDAGELSDPFEGYPDRVKYSVVIYGILYFLFLGVFLGFFLYKTVLIASSFEAEVLGGFMDIIGAKAGAQGNVAQKINYLIRNLAILTGALMLTITGGRRVFSFLLETREDK